MKAEEVVDALFSPLPSRNDVARALERAQAEARAERDAQWAEALGESGARVPCGCDKCAKLRALLEGK